MPELKIVKVESGFIAGESCGNGVNAFKGIPYAAPPVGELRWKAPQPPGAWEGIRDAGHYAPICPQLDLPAGSHAQVEFFPVPERKSEDCLYLNIWTAAVDQDERRPVLMWIHGGGFMEGSGSMPSFIGQKLAQKGVVVVTINYRLNIFGLFAHPQLALENEYNTSGNYAHLDQIAALKWIQRNIAAFGGDPGRVTIAGQSAGGISVCTLMVSPLSEGLFHRAIVQSGSAVGVSLLQTIEDACENGIRIMKEIGKRSIAEMRELSEDDLINVLKSHKYPLTPVVDRWLLPEIHSKLFSAAKQRRVPLLVGANSDEGTTMPVDNDSMVHRILGVNSLSEVEGIFDLYPEPHTGEEQRKFNISLLSDNFMAASRVLAIMQTGVHQDAYMYYFTRALPGRNSEFYKAFHSAELVYVFGTLDKTERPWEEIDRTLSDRMTSYWANFIANGDPNGAGLPAWTKFREDSFDVMELGERLGMTSIYNRDRIKFLQERILNRSFRGKVSA